MGVIVVVSSDSESEDEMPMHSPERKRKWPAWEPGPDRDGGSSPEWERMVKSRCPPCEVMEKGKQKIDEGEGIRAVEPPVLYREPLADGDVILGARCDFDTWNEKVSNSRDKGDDDAACCGADHMGRSVPVQKDESNKKGFHESYGQCGLLQDGSFPLSDNILATNLTSPVNIPLHPWDTGNRENVVAMHRQNSMVNHGLIAEYSSSTWLSRIKGLHFPLPDENQVRTRQIEADEMFARMLQEQFNQEHPSTQNPEQADTHIACILQEEDPECARIAAVEGQSTSNQMDSSMAQLYSYGQHTLVQSYDALTANHTLTSVPNRSDLLRSFSSKRELQNMIISQLANGCFRRENMDMETRKAILDSLVDVFDISGDTITSDSDDVEYENLIIHGDNNHPRGASDNEIDNLPLSVVEGGCCCNEPCPICLDCPVAGAYLRHLPCMHKFHKECIDRWLRMSISCPICKSNVI